MGRLLLFLAALLTFLSVDAEILVDRKGKPVRYAGNFSARKIDLPPYRSKSREFRGVWCSVVHNLDFPQCRDAAEFKRQFRALVHFLRQHNFNVLIFQVRSNCDAVYNSRHNPFSGWISGREGKGYGSFDPLPFMVRECHRSGMEFHAWLNPYRVTGGTAMSKKQYLATLAPGNIARKRSDLVLANRCANGKLALQLDPGNPEVINHILMTVREIIAKAPVDAIHLDDYFYPYEPLKPGCDNYSFRRFNPRKLPLERWRMENVNTLIRGISRLCRSAGVQFGVSPFGIWANAKDQRGGSLTAGMQSRNDLFADSLYWLQQGYVDYMIPQLYWKFDHPKAAYAHLVDWWVAAVRSAPRGTALYIGHSLNKCSSRELINQLRYNSRYRDIKGEAVFSSRFLRDRNISAVLRQLWRSPVPVR